MHPEVEQKSPGKCPKCGMNLEIQREKALWEDYIPLIVIIGLITLTTFVLVLNDLKNGRFIINRAISYFMIGFFLTFSGFKLIDLRGFAQSYNTYDLLAKRVYIYGFIYPFIELFFGLAMILNSASRSLLIAEVIIMGFSALGVGIKLLKKEKFQCACLGTFLKVPLTKVTLIEDFGMAALAGVMLFLGSH